MTRYDTNLKLRGKQKALDYFLKLAALNPNSGNSLSVSKIPAYMGKIRSVLNGGEHVCYFNGRVDSRANWNAMFTVDNFRSSIDGPNCFPPFEKVFGPP